MRLLNQCYKRIELDTPLYLRGCLWMCQVFFKAKNLNNWVYQAVPVCLHSGVIVHVKYLSMTQHNAMLVVKEFSIMSSLTKLRQSFLDIYNSEYFLQNMNLENKVENCGKLKWFPYKTGEKMSYKAQH